MHYLLKITEIIPASRLKRGWRLKQGTRLGFAMA